MPNTTQFVFAASPNKNFVSRKHLSVLRFISSATCLLRSGYTFPSRIVDVLLLLLLPLLGGGEFGACLVIESIFQNLKSDRRIYGFFLRVSFFCTSDCERWFPMNRRRKFTCWMITWHLNFTCELLAQRCCDTWQTWHTTAPEKWRGHVNVNALHRFIHIKYAVFCSGDKCPRVHSQSFSSSITLDRQSYAPPVLSSFSNRVLSFPPGPFFPTRFLRSFRSVLSHSVPLSHLVLAFYSRTIYIAGHGICHPPEYAPHCQRSTRTCSRCAAGRDAVTGKKGIGAVNNGYGHEKVRAEEKRRVAQASFSNGTLNMLVHKLLKYCPLNRAARNYVVNELSAKLRSMDALIFFYAEYAQRIILKNLHD